MTDDQIYRITLLRHAESQGNAKGILQGQRDYPLSNIGQQQTKQLTTRWKKEGFTFEIIISSPLLRARETAEAISYIYGIPIEFDPVWRERDLGRYSGRLRQEILEQFSHLDFITPYHPIGETGEAIWDLYIRGCQAINSLVQRPPASYLVVSHGGIINMVMYGILGIAPQANSGGPKFHLTNTGFITLEFHPAHNQWWVIGINDHQHLNIRTYPKKER